MAENRRAVEALQAKVSLLSSPSASFLSREPADRDSDNVERGHTLPQLVQGGRRAMNIQLSLRQAASSHPQPLPARGVGVPAWSDETTAGRALGRPAVPGGAGQPTG